MEDRVREFEVSSATVELAAQALNCEPCRVAKTLNSEPCRIAKTLNSEPCRIAKTLSFMVDGHPILKWA